MAEAASWKGYLKLSLVTCAIAVYPTTTAAERIAFHQLNRATGHRLKQRYVDAETGEPVERDQIVRGYEVGKGEYVQIEDEEFESIALESTRTIEIEQFVPREEVDPVYMGARHLVVPDDKVAVEPFSVIREAMRKSGKVGIGRLVINRRERIVMLEPRGKGILATTLHYPYEVRSDTPVFQAKIEGIEPAAELVRSAERLIEEKAGRFDPQELEDRYHEALRELIERKRKGRPPPKPRAPAEPAKVIDLFEALKRSIESERTAAPPEGRPAAKSRPRAKAPAKPRTAAKPKKS